MLLATSCVLSYADLKSDSLKTHNKYRTARGIQALTWSTTLAQSAQVWALHLARINKAQHSTKRVNVGENLAWGTAGNTVVGFINLWAGENKNFIPGKVYPKCSKTGSGSAVWHWTQMIWRKTTKVGCGMAKSSTNKLYYVCHYSPQGNIIGQPVY